MRTLTHPNPVVQEVLDIWTARFLNGGIPLGDLAATVAGISTWEEWGPAWMWTAARHEELAEEAWREGRRISAVGEFLTASRCYHLAYFLSVADLELHRRGLQKMVETHDRTLPYQQPTVEKVVIPFEGTHLPGLLSLPSGAERPPVVILLPGLDSTKETRHAGRGPLLRRGLAVLSIDGPGQGEVSLRLPARPDYETAVEAVIDYLERRDDVDPERVAVYGSSLGGYYACRAAAFCRRLVAAVENSGPFDWGACFDRLPLVTRRAFAHYSGAASLEEAGRRATEFTLRDVAEQIRVPLMVVQGGSDPLIPAEEGRRIAREANGPVTLLFVEEGEHSLNNLPYLASPAINDWLAARLGGTVA